MIRLGTSNRGAVLVEFAMAFLPVYAIFAVLMEVTRYSIARVAIQHAASVSVRACAVIQKPQNKGKDGVNGPESDIEKAGKVALLPWTLKQTLSDVSVECPEQGDVAGTDVAKVTATYHCAVPIGGQLVCGAMAFTTINATNNVVLSDPTTKIELQARMAHQGASYEIGE